MSIELVMPSNHLILCCALLLLPSIFANIKVFSNESALPIRWPKYRSFSFNISPSNEHPGPISFRMDWLDLLAVQGTLNSLLQHHSSKASILQHSAFLIVQLSHPYMTTRKIIDLTRQTFFDKVMSLLFILVYFFLCVTWRYFVFYFFLFFIFFIYFMFLLFFFIILKSLILTCVPKHEPPSHLPPHNISLGHPHAPAPSMLYPASDIDWRFNSYMIVYMLECHGVGSYPFSRETS